MTAKTDAEPFSDEEWRRKLLTNWVWDAAMLFTTKIQSKMHYTNSTEMFLMLSDDGSLLMALRKSIRDYERGESYGTGTCNLCAYGAVCDCLFSAAWNLRRFGIWPMASPVAI